MAKLYFYYAAMNAGKSTTLLQADYNYRERGMETMLWTARLDCILVDEAQFLSQKHVLQLCEVADRLSIPVLCYGLRTDFQGKLFPGSAALLALADSMVELKAVCECGRKATMN